MAVFRPPTGTWYQLNSSDGSFFGEQFGIATDKITPSDYDGDGKIDIAIYRQSDGLWYVKSSSTATYAHSCLALWRIFQHPAILTATVRLTSQYSARQTARGTS
jgi:hypothetical protein